MVGRVACGFMACLGMVPGLQAEYPLVPAFERFGKQLPPAEAKALLVTELNCTQCHHHPDLLPKGAPVLDGVGARLQPEWLRAFLTNPQKTRPGTTMPDALAKLPPGKRAQQVDALVHFLVSQKEGWQAPRLGKYSDPHTGGRRFNRIGCAACHADPITTERRRNHQSAGLVSLENLAAKYRYAALTDFLLNPLTHRPGGRMPDLQLELQEAADVAAYLMDTLDETDNALRGGLQPFTAEENKAEQGRQVFRQSGCANCHALGRHGGALAAKGFDEALAAACTQVDYSLSPVQEEALTAGLPQPTVTWRVKHTLATLNCYACHERKGLGGPVEIQSGHFTGDETLGNEGRFPPPLTGAGRKLRPAWLGKVLNGTGQLRPYLHTRMPVFGQANVAHLVSDLGAVDVDPDPTIVLSGGEIEAGRILLGTEGGVGCITCHALGERQGLAMPGLALNGATDRYQPAWFQENLIAPAKTRPATLMPSFWPDGVAGNQTILDGDTTRQIAAIWSYIAELGKNPATVEPPPGYPGFEPGAFEIIPRDRPVVQRTFMEGAGTHAIAVGFPDGVHLAFDAERCRLAKVWRGRFMDASKTWFSRRDPSAVPLGRDVKVLAKSEDEPKRHFRGYTLDKSGVPTFLYREGKGEISDRFEPNGSGGFKRSTTVRLPGAGDARSEEEITW